jgi:hypothetical protein
MPRERRATPESMSVVSVWLSLAKDRLRGSFVDGLLLELKYTYTYTTMYSPVLQHG